MLHRLTLGFIAIALAAGCGKSANTPPSERQLVDVGGHSLDTLIMGTGSPPVILDAGFIGGLWRWTTIQEQLSLHTRTLSYDRAGLGQSEMSNHPRTAKQIASELRTLLTNAGLLPPYVIAGHSAGGLFMRVFTAEYQDEVAGLVLVDPATEDAYDYWRIDEPDNWNGVEAEVTKNFGEPPAGWYGQWEELPMSIAQARQSWPLPDIPVIVFTAMKPISEEWMLANSERLNVWLEAHEALVQQIPKAEHIVIKDADHVSILEKTVVWQKILEIVEQTRH